MNVRRWFRFTLPALLFMPIYIGGFIAGYQHGNDAGFSRWKAEEYILQAYPISDLLPATEGESWSDEASALNDYLRESLRSKTSPLYIQRIDRFEITILQPRKRTADVESQLATLRSWKSRAEVTGGKFRIPQPSARSSPPLSSRKLRAWQ
jgi:hypothetical protein